MQTGAEGLAWDLTNRRDHKMFVCVMRNGKGWTSPKEGGKGSLGKGRRTITLWMTK